VEVWSAVLDACATVFSSTATAAAQRTALGLGTAAVQAVAYFLQSANNLSDLANAGTARANLGLGTAAVQAAAYFLQAANNLSDLASASTARTNLGLGSAAVQAAAYFLQSANNLSDLASASSARTNLGLGASAVWNNVVRETPSGSVNGTNATFTLANTPVTGSEQVFLNGLLQEPGAGNDYTISGATITYLAAPLTGDRLRVTYSH
jgi:hypothetical protein